MCGIAGAFDLTGTREFPLERLLAMTGAIAHRGPDDEQFHIEPGVALGAPQAVDHRPRGGPSADRQRGRLDLGRVQRRALRVSRAPRRASGTRPPAWRPAATPRPGSISTKTTARGCSTGRAASSPSRFGTAALARSSSAATASGSVRSTTPRPTAGCSGARRSRHSWPRAWSPPGPTRAASTTSSRSSAQARPARFSRGFRHCRRDIFSRSRMAVLPCIATGTSTFPTPAASAGSTTRRRSSTSSKRCSSRPSSAGSGATCRLSATSAAGSIRRSCSASAAASAASRSRRSRSVSTRPVPTSARIRPRRPPCWVRR